MPLTRGGRLPARTSTPIPGRRPEAPSCCGSTTPNNPTGAPSPDSRSSRGGRGSRADNDLLLAHDVAYTEVAYDGYAPRQLPRRRGRHGRRHRVPLAVEDLQHDRLAHRHGGRQRRRPSTRSARVKTNIDSGISTPSSAGDRRPETGRRTHRRARDVYQRRRDRVVGAGRSACASSRRRAPLRVGATRRRARRPAFAARLLDEAGVVVTPGIGYGASGEGYIRLSLTLPDDRLERLRTGPQALVGTERAASKRPDRDGRYNGRDDTNTDRRYRSDRAVGHPGARPRGQVVELRKLLERVPRRRAVDGSWSRPRSLEELARWPDRRRRVLDTMVQRRVRPTPATFVGKGKAEELADAVQRARRPTR